MILRRIKAIINKRRFGSFGENSHAPRDASGFLKNVFIGSNTSLGPNNQFNCPGKKVTIGDFVMTGPNVMFITGNHRIDLIGYRMAEVTGSMKLPSNDEDIIVEDDVWIGANAIILKGVRIGEGAVIGAGAVVTHDIPAFSIAGGVPARVIKPRFSPEDLKKHKELLKARMEVR